MTGARTDERGLTEVAWIVRLDRGAGAQNEVAAGLHTF